jgi:hypothetical protein
MWLDRCGGTRGETIESITLTKIKNKKMQKVFSEAAYKGDSEAVRALLADPRVDPAVNDNYVIRIASSRGHAGVVRALLAHPRVDPAADGNDAIRWASAEGHADAVRSLLADARVDPTSNNNAPILWASRWGHAGVVRALLADPRVDPSVAIPMSTKDCARIIARDDTRGGMEHFFDLFQKYHPDILREYQCYAVAWVATQECSWIDAVEPVSKRLKLLL